MFALSAEVLYGKSESISLKLINCSLVFYVFFPNSQLVFPQCVGYFGQPCLLRPVCFLFLNTQVSRITVLSGIENRYLHVHFQINVEWDIFFLIWYSGGIFARNATVNFNSVICTPIKTTTSNIDRVIQPSVHQSTLLLNEPNKLHLDPSQIDHTFEIKKWDQFKLLLSLI